jgi:hypothetical protein
MRRMEIRGYNIACGSTSTMARTRRSSDSSAGPSAATVARSRRSLGGAQHHAEARAASQLRERRWRGAEHLDGAGAHRSRGARGLRELRGGALGELRVLPCRS